MSIGVVIVTYNRKYKLTEALQKFDQQTYTPKYVLVVDNASTDGTSELLQEWKKSPAEYPRIVIDMESNVGGSGGFHRGLEESLKLDADWVWVSDDDAFPEMNALEKANEFLNNNMTDISAICGVVINNGEIDLAHRKSVVRRGKSIRFQSCGLSLYENEKFEMELFSYVGTIISVVKMREVGTTNENFFIWFDDSEHSLRLSRVGKIFCVPSIRIHHDVGHTGGEVSWKSYYGIRNEIYSVKELFEKGTYRLYVVNALMHSIKKYIAPSSHLKGKLEIKGIMDGRKGRLGIHDTFKPGWKPKED